MKTTMKFFPTASLTRLAFVAVLLPLVAAAQPPPAAPPDPGVTDPSIQDSSLQPFGPSELGPTAGNFELSIGGSGVTNKDFDSSSGGVNFAFGKYVNDTLLVGLRQAVNYSNPRGRGTSYNGSSLLVVNQHFGQGTLRPFVGANFGGVYGDDVHDSWAAGLEAGAKYYVQPKTFVYALAQYEWLFDRGSQIDNRFSDGQFIWSLGVGFHF